MFFAAVLLSIGGDGGGRVTVVVVGDGVGGMGVGIVDGGLMV